MAYDTITEIGIKGDAGPPGPSGSKLVSQSLAVGPVGVQAVAGFVTPVDARSGIVSVNTPTSPTADQVFAVQDVYGAFATKPLQLYPQGSGVAIYDNGSGTYKTSNAAIVSDGGAATYYFQYNASLNAWVPA